MKKLKNFSDNLKSIIILLGIIMVIVFFVLSAMHIICWPITELISTILIIGIIWVDVYTGEDFILFR